MKPLKKAEGHISQNIASITIKMKTIVQIFQVMKTESIVYAWHRVDFDFISVDFKSWISFWFLFGCWRNIFVGCHSQNLGSFITLNVREKHVFMAENSESLIARKHYIIIIITIMSRRQQGSPWTSLNTLLYRPSLLVGLQGYILYRHRAVVHGF